MDVFFVEVPCRIELQYPVLQTGASPLGQGTLSGCKGSAFYLPCKIFSLFFKILVIQSSQRQSKYLLLRQLAPSSGMVMRVHQQFSLCEHSNVLLHSGQVFCIVFNFIIQKNRLPIGNLSISFQTAIIPLKLRLLGMHLRKYRKRCIRLRRLHKEFLL